MTIVRTMDTNVHSNLIPHMRSMRSGGIDLILGTAVAVKNYRTNIFFTVMMSPGAPNVTFVTQTQIGLNVSVVPFALSYTFVARSLTGALAMVSHYHISVNQK